MDLCFLLGIKKKEKISFNRSAGDVCSFLFVSLGHPLTCFLPRGWFKLVCK